MPHGISSSDFEVATEYGAPMAAGPPVEAAVLGYKFDHYDLRSSFTWQYLSRATADEVRAVMNSILASDLKLINGLTLRRLFNPNPEHTREGFTAYGLWSNDGSMSPPPFLGTQFPSSTTHYVASQAAVIDSGDVEDLVALVRTKGYGLQSNSQLLHVVQPAGVQGGPDLAGRPAQPPQWTGARLSAAITYVAPGSVCASGAGRRAARSPHRVPIPHPHRRRSRRSGSEPAGGDPMNPDWLDPVIDAAKHIREHPDASEFGGRPGPTRYPHLRPGPDPDPRLPRYRAVYAPISPPQSASDIEVGPIAPRGTGAVS